MNTDTLEQLRKIIEAHKHNKPLPYPKEQVKEICNEFALSKKDEELIDYLMMLEYSISTYDFRMLMVEIYESL